MSRIGADPQALVDLATQMRTTADHIELSGRRLSTLVANAGWEGPDATNFQAQWATRGTSISRASVALRQDAERLKHNAAQQTDASNGDSAATPPVSILTGLRQSRVASPISTTRVDGPLSRQQILSGSFLPTSTRRWRFDAGGTLGLGSLGLARTLEIQDFDGEYSKVTLGLDGGGGITAGAGTTLSLDAGEDEFGLVGDASVGAELTGGGSVSWTVNDSDAEAFMRDRAIDSYLGANIPDTSGTFWGNLIPGSGNTIDWIGDRLEDAVGLFRDLPDPDITTTSLGGLAISAGALGTLGMARGGIEFKGEASVSKQERRGYGESTVFSASGEGAGYLSSELFGGLDIDEGVEGASMTTVTVGPQVDDVRTITLTSENSTNDPANHAIATFEVSEENMKGALESGLERLERGDVQGAAESLRQVEVRPVSYDRAESTTTSRDYGLDASMEAGPGGSIGGEFESSRTSYRR